MTVKAYGLDFGTSNSSIAIVEDRQANVLPIDPAATNPRVTSSVLYINRAGEVSIGAEAVLHFVDQNRQREIRRQRVSTGHIIETDFGDEYVQFDADVNLPGRFFQSTKSFLKDITFEGTLVFGAFLTIEDLIAKFLGKLKIKADAFQGSTIDAVVLGRPVYFSSDADKDALAEQRLHDAAKIAGFKHVEFLFEPIGSALAYEATISREEVAFVFDFGGGTLDFTIARIGPGHMRRADRSGDILAVGGVVIGGNTFDEEIMKKRLTKYYGSGYQGKTTAGKTLEMPAWIMAELQSWYRIPLLNERKTIDTINELIGVATKGRQELLALLSLIKGNYGWDLFQEIEQAKIELTDQQAAQIVFQKEGINVREDLSRNDFETIIATHLRVIGEEIDKTLALAGLQPQDIDVVIRTGGSSLIPAVQHLLVDKFGADKIYKQEVFTSVVAGLALASALKFG